LVENETTHTKIALSNSFKIAKFKNDDMATSTLFKLIVRFFHRLEQQVASLKQRAKLYKNVTYIFVITMLKGLCKKWVSS